MTNEQADDMPRLPYRRNTMRGFGRDWSLDEDYDPGGLGASNAIAPDKPDWPD